MREMSQRAQNNNYDMPPSPIVKKVGEAANTNDTPKEREIKEGNSKKEEPKGIKGFIDNLLSGSGEDIGKPIFDKLGADPDMLLILGLLLILHSEKSDRMLLLALLYILM